MCASLTSICLLFYFILWLIDSKKNQIMANKNVNGHRIIYIKSHKSLIFNESVRMLF